MYMRLVVRLLTGELPGEKQQRREDKVKYG